ncbi:NotI family restriction endonuclease [Sphingomonas adhaesiva]|uniref:NotI family restriction endonuclease n=1 Tax=Sphingomonas adhaesiva TaxID=28212 RepID=UPI002FFBF598
MTRIVDLFGHDADAMPEPDWADIVARQHCPFTERHCYKTRKSQPEIAIGTCTVEFGKAPIMICPLRLLERRQIFIDCLHLLTGHEPGNELHIVSEVSVPGGNIDYILTSIRNGMVRDFVAIELQTLDTTGTVWPERQRFITEKGIPGASADDLANTKSYGMNWKMTTKTIMVQLHHKIQTLEALNKHLVLIVQDRLLAYMKREFCFDHVVAARVSDPMHFHAYELTRSANGTHSLSLATRLSTDSEGVAKALGLQNEATVDLEVIHRAIERRITQSTRFDFRQPPSPLHLEADE